MEIFSKRKFFITMTIIFVLFNMVCLSSPVNADDKKKEEIKKKGDEMKIQQKHALGENAKLKEREEDKKNKGVPIKTQNEVNVNKAKEADEMKKKEEIKKQREQQKMAVEKAKVAAQEKKKQEEKTKQQQQQQQAKAKQESQKKEEQKLKERKAANEKDQQKAKGQQNNLINGTSAKDSGPFKSFLDLFKVVEDNIEQQVLGPFQQVQKGNENVANKEKQANEKKVRLRREIRHKPNVLEEIETEESKMKQIAHGLQFLLNEALDNLKNPNGVKKLPNDIGQHDVKDAQDMKLGKN